MGHKDKTAFEHVYRHRLRPEIHEAAELMDDIWGRADGRHLGQVGLDMTKARESPPGPFLWAVLDLNQ